MHQQGSVKERSVTDVNEPSKYNAVIHNDDFTPMDFVVKVLTDIFFKPKSEAMALMLRVHHSDKAVAGTYSYDIALSKVNKATEMARSAGFPLRFTVEPASND